MEIMVHFLLWVMQGFDHQPNYLERTARSTSCHWIAGGTPQPLGFCDNPMTTRGNQLAQVIGLYRLYGTGGVVLNSPLLLSHSVFGTVKRC